MDAGLWSALLLGLFLMLSLTSSSSASSEDLQPIQQEITPDPKQQHTYQGERK